MVLSSLVIEVLVITVGCFLAALINAAFATGGVYLMLASTTAVLPVSVAIPLQSMLAMASLIARIWLFRTHIHWPLVLAFVPTAAVGALFGIHTFANLNDDVIAILLGVVLLIMIWVPVRRLVLNLGRHFFAIGLIHGYLGTVFGVGAVLQPAILRTELVKLQITGTLAICLLSLDVFKITGYVAIGFDYTDYGLHICLAIIAGILGSLLGKRVTHHVSEAQFRLIFKILITVVAMRLLLTGMF